MTTTLSHRTKDLSRRFCAFAQNYAAFVAVPRTSQHASRFPSPIDPVFPIEFCARTAQHRRPMKPGASAEKKLEIKKYANRRYYDATHSRHLTLEEIRSLIHEGYDVRVIDAKTSADITAQILTQIILELETGKLDSLPVPLLVRIIRVNDQLVKDFVDRYFNQALQSFLDYQRKLEEQLRRAHGLPSAVPSVADWTKAMIEPWTRAFSGAPASGSDDADLRELVLKLQQEILDLKQQGKRRKKR